MLLVFVLIIALTAELQAAVLSVPVDYPNIQSALNAVQTNDTVWVGSGTYHESLTGPPVSFYLIGEAHEDSVLDQRPIVDPSSIVGSNQLSCLRLFGEATVVQNIVFRNGPEMFPHVLAYEGGVVLEGESADFLNCLFDSTNTGCRSTTNHDLTLTNCDFVRCPTGPLFVERSTVIADQCHFDHRGFSCGQGSEFRACLFDSISLSQGLNLSGRSIVENCIFLNHDASGMSTIEGSSVSGRISGCVFVDCRPSLFVLGFVRNCADSLIIEGNRFENIASYAQAGGTIGLGCADNSAGGSTSLRNNVFVHCNGTTGGKCFRAANDSTTTEILHNRFIANFGSGSAIQLESPHSFLRLNAFINNGYAVSSVYACDARLNFWGDSTGPYNELFNPDGLGDRVSDSVVFDSWYPDTSFLIESAQNPPQLPSEFSLSVFPNPFNSTATISLDVPTAFIASIELHNTLGQRVREIHRGPVYGHEKFHLNADNLPSGVYFVSVRDIVQHSMNSSHKIALIR